MPTLIVVAFQDESQAQEGARVLQALHDQGSLALYGSAVLTKGPDGQLKLNEVNEGPLGLAMGALIGGLLGLLGGPLGAAIGAAGGAAVGSLYEIAKHDTRQDFVQLVSGQMPPGRAALIAEIAEYGESPLDERMRALGGIVSREHRVDVEYRVVQHEAVALRQAAAAAQAEYAAASAEARAERNAELEAARARLVESAQRVKLQLARMNQVTEAEVARLRQMAEQAPNAATRQVFENQIAEARAEHDRRLAQLNEAWSLAQEALNE